MSDGTTRGRGRRSTPPPRDILGGRVRDDELPDVARPVLSGPASAADPGAPAGRPRTASGFAPLPWQLAGIVLGAQAATIADSLARGLVPPVLVPGAIVLEAQLRAAALILSPGS